MTERRTCILLWLNAGIKSGTAEAPISNSAYDEALRTRLSASSNTSINATTAVEIDCPVASNAFAASRRSNTSTSPNCMI